MKFSVVIPCHDRLELLQKAIYTVLEQDFDDWELAIFDNDSKDDIQEYLKTLSHKFQGKIKYKKSEGFLPVTDSWNNAIEMASGEYVIFLGDDDGLVPNYFQKILPIIQAFNHPDVVYCALYQFLYPGVAPWDRSGYVAELKNAFFFDQHQKPFLLSSTKIQQAVEGSLQLRRNFTFNIQAFLFSQNFLNVLRKDGPVFRSSFPDYYLANVAIAKAKQVVVVPQAMAIAGVSKASVGYALFNGMEDKFTGLLNSKMVSDIYYPKIQNALLPGPAYNSSYILAMQHVVEYLPQFDSCGVNFKKYRKLQIFRAIHEEISKGSFNISFWDDLSISEKIWACKTAFLIKLSSISPILKGLIDGFITPEIEMIDFHPAQKKSDHCYNCLTEIFEAISKDTLFETH